MTVSPQQTLAPLGDKVREICRENAEPDRARALIEVLLEETFEGLSPEQKILRLRDLIGVLGKTENYGAASRSEGQSLGRLVPLLLGKQIEEVPCSPMELLQRLATAMNTVFDSLNELKQAINGSLLGQDSHGETIRLVIASNVEGGSEERRLQEYLDQIKEAFFIMYAAFKDSALGKLREALSEIEPERIANEVNGGMKVGPFRKAEMFEVFQEKHHSLMTNLENGRIAESLLRDFEKRCQRLFAEKGKANV